MSLSQLYGKQTINYAKLRQMRSPNDAQSFGLRQEFNDFSQLHRQPVETNKHQRAKSTLQNNYRQGTPLTDLEEMEGEKLFDQFFKFNNSKSESDFMRDSMQRDQKQPQSEFLRFVENAIEYHKQSELHFRPTIKKNQHLEQKTKELTVQNRLLASEINRYKQREMELKNKIKIIQKECQLELGQLIQKNEWLEELLVKQKIDNENSLLAVKKSLEMMQGRCMCQKGMADKIMKEVKQQSRPQYDLQATHSSSELSSNTGDEDLDFDYVRRRKSLSKTSEEHQFQLARSKNLREFARDQFFRKKPTQDPYYT
ncbi:unnamed protein product (macronuclear) [Paramecium tetraurelia]|uniref:Uncharacterized protein n=1 Tax=Paramecium tetraurelia TaxID=5888 RepID=A0CNF2_PARTE|nr:uncharacterized protein GSPATT00008761001 [Paramecium tetraurelia]CAK72319.1 unnamed protein product [Paramecium tetraurelia]|eukprot:XP_001439716.1 hypothetical protein (macronuclear) [Paramecium tetraurelia strain d4-2]